MANRDDCYFFNLLAPKAMQIGALIPFLIKGLTTTCINPVRIKWNLAFKCILMASSLTQKTVRNLFVNSQFLHEF